MADMETVSSSASSAASSQPGSMADMQEQRADTDASPVPLTGTRTSDPNTIDSPPETDQSMRNQIEPRPATSPPVLTPVTVPTGPSVSSASSQSGAKQPQTKRTPNDFIFGKLIGEGSFSSVYLAKEVSKGTEYAIKVCDKKFILKMKKSEYIMREKTVLTKTNHPFIVKLYYTFQDPDRLYFVLEYARKGELLYYLKKLSSFDLKCTCFYAAEIVEALEYLQSQGIIHRDLKPENILLNDRMHIMITDFGSAKVLKMDEPDGGSDDKDTHPSSAGTHRRNSFVGTAHYISPEVLNSHKAYFSSDLWALGCIIFELLSGEMPFRGGHEYQIFQKLCKLDYEIPEGFNPVAADLVQKLLVLDPTQRLGCKESGGMSVLRQHSFFEDIVWEKLENQMPPELVPYLPATERNPEFWSSQDKTGFDDRRLAEIIISSNVEPPKEVEAKERKEVVLEEMTQDVHRKKLESQASNNEYHVLVEGNLILKQGKVLKRKGLFARKRMLLLTEGPHLYYVDYTTKEKVLKGQIPWSHSLKPEAKNFKVFFVHTPNRTYYLESRDSEAHEWERQINEVWQRYYGTKK